MTRVALLALAVLLIAASRPAHEPVLRGQERSVREPIGTPLPNRNVLPAAASHLVHGIASYYCGGGSACTKGYHPGDLIGAIDTSTGFHKGDLLRVMSKGRSVVVLVVDVCGCPGARVIDLSRAAFARLADPSVGLIPVTLELVGGIDVPAVRPLPTAPSTDVGP